MPTARDTAEIAAGNVRRANADADVLEAETKAARERAARVVETAKTEQRNLDRQMKLSTSDAAGQVRGLGERLARVIASKASVHPSPDLRGLGRKFLRSGLEYFELERLGNADPRFAELFGLTTTAQQAAIRFFADGIRDESVFTALDSFECRAWRAVIERARVLAGEVPE